MKLSKYKKLPANDPQGELRKRGYNYIGYWGEGYVQDINGAEVKGYYWCRKDTEDTLVAKLQEAGFMGRTVKSLYGVNVLVIIEETIPVLDDQEDW
ncbi:hypothetical protein [Leptolyngbya phage Lbo240-yong1]|uniref:Uncharacterized protein n=1 Tax=Leptolyngbya phage Lbo240-yong1 TaxID=2928836 RepID=A0A9X9H2U3_9CAUD|nr:hypothetical protein [Leptolyngbya phage Lbo240-yong1]